MSLQFPDGTRAIDICVIYELFIRVKSSKWVARTPITHPIYNVSSVEDTFNHCIYFVTLFFHNVKGSRRVIAQLLLELKLQNAHSYTYLHSSYFAFQVVVAGVSEDSLKRKLPQLAWGLARQGGPSAAQLARIAMLRLKPSLLLEQLLQPHCLSARNAKVIQQRERERECTKRILYKFFLYKNYFHNRNSNRVKGSQITTK